MINYDLPIKYGTREPDYEVYLHRIGRAGRFGRKGNSTITIAFSCYTLIFICFDRPWACHKKIKSICVFDFISTSALCIPI